MRNEPVGASGEKSVVYCYSRHISPRKKKDGPSSKEINGKTRKYRLVQLFFFFFLNGHRVVSRYPVITPPPPPLGLSNEQELYI